MNSIDLVNSIVDACSLSTSQAFELDEKEQLEALQKIRIQVTDSIFASSGQTDDEDIEGIDDTDEFTSVEEMEKNQQTIVESIVQSNISHLPKDFLGVDMTSLGMMSSSIEEYDQHSFFKLHKEALNPKNNFDDRLQALRALCYTPIMNTYKYLLEVAKAFIDDDTLTSFEKFMFFAKQGSFTKLPNMQLVIDCHKYFFEQRNVIKPSTEVLLLNIRFLLQYFDFDSNDRNRIINLMLDMLEEETSTHRIKAEIYDIFITCGTAEERLFGEQQVAKLGGKDNYTNTETVHTLPQGDTARNILNTLRKKFVKADHKYIDMLRDRLQVMIELDDTKTECIRNFFSRITVDSTRFDNFNLLDITSLVYQQITTMDKEKQEHCVRVLLEEIIDMNGVCTSGYLMRLVNSLQGFVEDSNLQLNIDIEKECRYAVFARLNFMIKSLPPETQKEVLDSLSGEDKQTVEEYITYYWDDYDLIQEYKGILDASRVREIADKACREFVHSFSV